jgi:hypothetical protein
MFSCGCCSTQENSELEAKLAIAAAEEQVKVTPTAYDDDSKEVKTLVTPVSVLKPAAKEGSMMEFRVALKRGEGETLGVELDNLGLRSAQVLRVFDQGLVKKYNDGSDAQFRVRSGDFILEVNNCRGDTRRMIKLLAEEPQIEMVMGRPTPWAVTVHQSAGEILPALKCADVGVSVLVVTIPPIIAQWNRDNPSKVVQELDVIADVNGVTGNAKSMMEQFEKAAILDLKVIRPTQQS